MASRKTALIIDTGSSYPALKLDSTLSFYDASNEANGFLVNSMIDYMDEVLVKSGPIYLFDQACRYRAACLCKKNNMPVEDLNVYLRGHWRYFFKAEVKSVEAKKLEDKWKKDRSNSRYRLQGMSADKRLIYAPVEEK
jgi:hypothetical protein